MNLSKIMPKVRCKIDHLRGKSPDPKHRLKLAWEILSENSRAVFTGSHTAVGNNGEVQFFGELPKSLFHQNFWLSACNADQYSATVRPTLGSGRLQSK